MVLRSRLSAFLPVESTIFLARESLLTGVGEAMSRDEGAGSRIGSGSGRKASNDGVAAWLVDSVASAEGRDPIGSPGSTAAAVVSGRPC
jgi:hypothetical protein